MMLMKSKADFKSNTDDALKEISFMAFLMLAICIADSNNNNNNNNLFKTQFLSYTLCITDKHGKSSLGKRRILNN